MPFSLGHISVKESCLESISDENLMDCFGIPFGMGENKDLILRMGTDKFDDVIQFLFMVYRDISMMDLIYRYSFAYFNEFIAGNMLFDNGFHIIVHGRRKGKRLLNML